MAGAIPGHCYWWNEMVRMFDLAHWFIGCCGGFGGLRQSTRTRCGREVGPRSRASPRVRACFPQTIAVLPVHHRGIRPHQDLWGNDAGRRTLRLGCRGRCRRTQLLFQIAPIRHASSGSWARRALPAFTAPIGVFVGMPLRQVWRGRLPACLRGVQTYDDQPPTEDTFPFAHVPAFVLKIPRARTRAPVHGSGEGAGPHSGGNPHRLPVEGRWVDGSRRPWELLVGFDPGFR